MRIISDDYANNAGYVRPLQAMLKQLSNNGFRGVSMNQKLTGIFRSDEGKGGTDTILEFATGKRVHAKVAVLNLPQPALLNLNPESVIFTDATEKVRLYLSTFSLLRLVS